MQKRITSNAMESLALRKSSYKVKSPPWKETFRECCSEGLKKRRQKLFDRFRQLPQSDDLEDNCSHSYRRSFEMLVEEVIKEEWYVFKGSQRRLSLQLSEGQNSEALEESNEVKDIWKQIQEELVMEEQNHLRKLDTEEAEQYGFEVLRTDEVICPVCQRFSLTQAGSVIFCLCGLQVDTEQDSFTLHNFQQQLDKGIDQHNNSCNVSSHFSVRSEYGITNLLITCEVCNFMFIVV